MVLGKTYFCDIDGTIVKNLSEKDLERHYPDDTFIQELLYGVEHFFNCLKENDTLIFTTARIEKYREMTERTLNHWNIKWSLLIMGLPMGRRYLINDTPNVFFKKAIEVNVLRDEGFGDTFIFEDDFYVVNG